MRRSDATFLLIAAMLSISTSASAQTNADRCQAANSRAAGKYYDCMQKLEYKALLTGMTADYSTCTSKFELAWFGADAKFPSQCPDLVSATEANVYFQDQVYQAQMVLSGEIYPLPVCGDGVRNNTGEQCDGDDIPYGDTCQSKGYLYGSQLGCRSNCTLDYAGCSNSRFVDNLNGTVTDRQTNLTWEKKASLNGSTSSSNLHDADNTYRWSCLLTSSPAHCQPTAASAAACTAGADQPFNVACSQCSTACSSTTIWSWLVALNAANFAGHSDWRIPTRGELESLVDWRTSEPSINYRFDTSSGCSSGCTDLNSASCSCTLSDLYWSASTRFWQPVDNSAWYVTFGAGRVDETVMESAFAVRAVRGG